MSVRSDILFCVLLSCDIPLGFVLFFLQTFGGVEFLQVFRQMDPEEEPPNVPLVVDN